mgnify:CR=1 FL=1
MAADQAAYFFPFRYSDGDIPSVFLNERIKKLAELYPTASATSLMVICFPAITVLLLGFSGLSDNARNYDRPSF